MWKKIILLSCCFFVTKVYATQVQATEKVIWLTEVTSEVEDIKNKKSISISIDTTRYMLSNLTDFIYERHFESLARIKRLLQSKTDTTYCKYSRIKTSAREKFGYFSQPIHLYPSLQLYYNVKNHLIVKNLLDENGKLTSLKKLFSQNPDKFLTVVYGRSYGEFLDQQLENLPKKSVYFRQGQDQYTTITLTLLKGRIDFALVYPTKFIKKIENEIYKGDGKLTSVGIKGNIPYILGRVMCSKTPLGKTVIEKINSTLDKIYLHEKFYQLHTDYLPESYHQTFKKDFQYVFIERNFN